MSGKNKKNGNEKNVIYQLVYTDKDLFNDIKRIKKGKGAMLNAWLSSKTDKEVIVTNETIQRIKKQMDIMEKYLKAQQTPPEKRTDDEKLLLYFIQNYISTNFDIDKSMDGVVFIDETINNAIKAWMISTIKKEEEK